MSKKKVISDFSDLKGKIAFTPKTAALNEDSCSKDGDQQERGLQVGQSVVLMDSDLRGKITKLGKRVSIELEDGLVIEAAYGEFAVTDQEEVSSLKKAKVKPHGSKQVHSRKMSRPTGDGSLTVDLHIEAIPGGRSVPKGQQLQFQMDIFRRTIRENLPHKGLKITFIHGIGDGILKTAIRKELDEVFVLKCSYSVGDPAVTVVTII